MKVIFMGTPDFAVPCLRALVLNGYEVAGVFTQPDKPQGRKQVLTPPEVKQYALEHGLTVHQPSTLKDGKALSVIQEANPDIMVVVAYGKILPKTILDVPKYGCINIHGSLLPKYRGAGPIQWSVINGERETGVTSMYMAEGLDTGDMILQSKTEILPEETAGELFDRLKELAAQNLLETLERIKEGKAEHIPQNEAESSYAPMLDKTLARLDFQQSASKLHDLIRGMNPWPVAFTTLEGKKMKVYSSVVKSGAAQGKPGSVTVSEGHHMLVTCGQDCLELTEIQFEGKKRMTVEDYLRGHQITPGTMLGKE